MKISVIIPNYNGESLLKNNLKKISEIIHDFQKGSKHEVELIIIDDASKDGSVSYIDSFIKQNKTDTVIHLQKNEKNLGFSPTINKAVKSATGDILYLLNSDVLPEKDFLEHILPHFDDKNVFAVGSMDKSVENGKVVLRGRGIGTWKKGFLMHRRGEVDKANTLWVNGGSGAFRKEIWEKLSGFCELYKPYYWEDIDLSYRALKSGYDLVFESKSVVTHEHEEGAILQTQSEKKITTIAYRNQFLFVWLNVADSGILMQHFFWLPYHFLKALRSGDRAFFSGFAHAFIKLPNIIQLRLKASRNFTRGDKDVVAAFTA